MNFKKWIKITEDSGFGFYVGDTVAVFTYSRKVGREWIKGQKFILPLAVAKRVLKPEYGGDINE